MYKIKSTKPVNHGVYIHLMEDGAKRESISVYRHYEKDEHGENTHAKAMELAEWVEGKLNAPLLSAAMPAEIDVTEPTFGWPFFLGAISGGIVTFIVTALVYLFCFHLQ
jgi:hypothetical protein